MKLNERFTSHLPVRQCTVAEDQSDFGADADSKLCHGELHPEVIRIMILMALMIPVLVTEMVTIVVTVMTILD